MGGWVSNEGVWYYRAGLRVFLFKGIEYQLLGSVPGVEEVAGMQDSSLPIGLIAPDTSPLHILVANLRASDSCCFHFECRSRGSRLWMALHSNTRLLMSPFSQSPRRLSKWDEWSVARWALLMWQPGQRFPELRTRDGASTLKNA